MRRESRKFGYSWDTLGEWLQRSRETLGWSYRQLARAVFDQTGCLIAPGTLLHVARGERSLPGEQRRALARTLVPALRGARRRRLWVTPKLVASGAPAPADPLISTNENWEAQRAEHLALARAAGGEGDWAAWAGHTLEGGLLDLTLGRLASSARLLDGVLAAEPRAIGRDLLARAYVNRGWLAMEETHFAAGVALLRRAEELTPAGAPESERIWHFLGRLLCAYGVTHDDAQARAAGRYYLDRALDRDRLLGATPTMGYDLLQQVSSLVHDDPRLARRYIYQGAEWLGLDGVARGRYYLYLGQLALDTAPAQARERLEKASAAYTGAYFYPRGQASALRMLSGLYEDQAATLLEAAAHALVAALIHPYRQSHDRLEWIATRIYITLCDSVGRRFTAFWRAQGERAARMEGRPYDLLRGFLATAGGAASLPGARAQAEAAIRRGAPQWAALEPAPLLAG